MTEPTLLEWGQWHIARTLFGLNVWGSRSLYRSARLQRFVERIWPAKFSREAPPWSF